MRLDKFLTDRYANLTRSQITNAIKDGKASVNGKPVTKCGYEISQSDEIQFDEQALFTPTEQETRAQNIPLDIVFQDEYLMIINKPRGMVTHPGAGNRENTLLNALLGLEKNGTCSQGLPHGKVLSTAENGGRPLRCGIVHRLDKNTAGLLVVAKDAQTQGMLSEMIEKRQVEREYLGLVEGVINGSGTIDRNIIRDPKHRTLFTVCDAHRGRRAVTHYVAAENCGKYTLVRFKLETGRTHQIRVHAKSINRPLVGDPEYNPKSKYAEYGQMLESVRLSFIHPRTEKPVTVEIPPTELFTDIKNRCFRTNG